MADDEENDPSASFNELEAFDSIWHALRWKQVKKRLPICARKTIQNRYFFANLVYLVYAIGILLIDYLPYFNEGGEPETTTEVIGNTTEFNSATTEMIFNTTEIISTTLGIEAEEAGFTPTNIFYIVLAVIHVISATLYWWAWKDHRWNDVIMFPEYLNHIEASLYLWSAVWYAKEDVNDLYSYYTLTVHKLETVAAFVELFASFGWIMSWYRTYTRTIGRGYSLDDPDTVAFTLTTVSSFIYITYNIQILVDPSEYGGNVLYKNGDIIYFIGAVFYLWANLRDDGWLWWLPVAGQYGVAPGRIQMGRPIQTGLGHYLIGGTHPCRCPSKSNHVSAPAEVEKEV